LIPVNLSNSREDRPIIECLHVPATIAGITSWKWVTRRPTAASSSPKQQHPEECKNASEYFCTQKKGIREITYGEGDVFSPDAVSLASSHHGNRNSSEPFANGVALAAGQLWN